MGVSSVSASWKKLYLSLSSGKSLYILIIGQDWVTWPSLTIKSFGKMSIWYLDPLRRRGIIKRKQFGGWLMSRQPKIITPTFKFSLAMFSFSSTLVHLWLHLLECTSHVPIVPFVWPNPFVFQMSTQASPHTWHAESMCILSSRLHHLSCSSCFHISLPPY